MDSQNHQNSTQILKKLHSLFIQNKNLKEGIKDMYDDINKELVKRNDPREKIRESMKKETNKWMSVPLYPNPIAALTQSLMPPSPGSGPMLGRL